MGVLKEIKQNNRKKIWRTIIIFLIIILGGSWYYYNNSSKNTAVFKTFEVTKGDIASTLSADGKIQYKEQYDLNFPTSGTLAKVYKKEGDTVKKGEIIASLDDTYLIINLDKAKIALETAVANLNAKIATKQQASDILVTEKQLESSKTSLDATIKQGQIDSETAQKNLDSAKVDYNNALSNLDIIKTQESLNIINSQDKGMSEIDNALPYLEKYLHDADIVLGATDLYRNLNDSYEIYLGARDGNSLLTATNKFKEVNSSLQDFKNEWILYRLQKDKTKIADYIDKFNIIENDCGNVIGGTSNVLKNTIPGGTLTQAAIDTMILNFESEKNNIENLKQKLLAAKQSLDLAKVAYATKIESQQNIIEASKSKLNLAQNNLDSTKAKLKNNIELSNSQIGISEANLNLKKTGYDKRELEPFYAAINNAKKGISEAQKRLDDAKIVSPIDGKIGKMPITKVGTVLTQNTANPFAVIINKNSLFIEAKIEEGDIPKVRLGQDVKLTFNSLDNVNLTGSVSYISDKAEIDVNSIVSYKVEVIFNPGDSSVKEGFSTQIYFILEKVKDAILVPFEAVTEEGDKKFVTTINGTKKEIKVGINDGDFYEVISGVKVGDKLRK